MAITERLFHPKPPFLSFLTGWNSPITGLAFPGYCAPSTAFPATDGGLASGSPGVQPKVPSLTIISHTKIMTHFILIGNCHGYNGKKTMVYRVFGEPIFQKRPKNDSEPANYFREIFLISGNDLLEAMGDASFIVAMMMMTGWWCNNHLEKYEFVNGKDYPFVLWKIKFMFETTNQMMVTMMMMTTTTMMMMAMTMIMMIMMVMNMIVIICHYQT